MPAYDDEIRNNQLAQITARAGNAAKLRAYTAPQPAKNGTPTTLLAEWTLGSPFAATPSGGTLSPTLPADVVGLASGQVGWLRIVQSDGTTFVMDLRASEIAVNTSNITAGQPCKVLGFNIVAGNNG